jgi:hypothetical protein
MLPDKLMEIELCSPSCFHQPLRPFEQGVPWYHGISVPWYWGYGRSSGAKVPSVVALLIPVKPVYPQTNYDVWHKLGDICHYPRFNNEDGSDYTATGHRTFIF